MEIPFRLRLRAYAWALALVFASVPAVHVYLAVDLTWGELLLHAVDITLGVVVGLVLIEAGAAPVFRSWDWRIESRWGLLGVGLFALTVLVAVPRDDLLPHTEEIRRRHVESGYADMGVRLLPVVGVIVLLVGQSVRLSTLATELREQRELNEALRLRQAEPEPARVQLPLRLPEGDDLELDVHDVVRVQAQENYCEFVTATGGAKLVRITLLEARDRLPDAGFLQVHRSHLVNLRHVDALGRDGRNALLVLQNGDRVPIARARADAVRGRLRAWAADRSREPSSGELRQPEEALGLDG